MHTYVARLQNINKGRDLTNQFFKLCITLVCYVYYTVISMDYILYRHMTVIL